MTKAIIMLSMVAIFLIMAPIAPVDAAEPEPTGVTIVLLPTSVEPAEIHIARPNGPNAACLTFDLSEIPNKNPQGLSVELRLVGFRSQSPRPQIVNVFKGCDDPPTDGPIAGWRVQGQGDGILASVESSIEDTQDGLATTVLEAVGRELKLLVRSDDDASDWKYASLETSYAISDTGKLEAYKSTDEAFRSSTRPRLILRYEAPTGASGVSSYTAHRAFGVPRSDAMAEVRSFTRIVSGPLPYQNALIVIAKTAEETTEVVALSPYGNELWKCPIQGRIDETDVTIAAQLRQHSVIDGEGRLYNFGANAITLYDLKEQCPETGHFPSALIANPTGIAPQAQPTIAAGGNLYLVGAGENNYVYGLTPGTLQELWRSEARAGTEIGRLAVSSPNLTCGPDTSEQDRAVCHGIVYALTPAYGRLDAATGAALPPVDGWVVDDDVDENWLPYAPVVTAGAEDDIVVLAATGNAEGRLAAFSGEELAWESTGSVAAQPILAQDDSGPVVLTIQNNRFQRFSLDSGDLLCQSEPLEAFSCDGPGCTSTLYRTAAAAHFS